MLNRIFQRFIYSLLHAVGLLLLATIALNLDYNFATEETEVSNAVFLGNLLGQQVDVTTNFTFINVSGSKVLIPRPDSTGNEAITDRKKLISLFAAISRQKSSAKFILCDLIFDKVTAFDAELERSMNAIPNIVVPYGKEGDTALMPYFKNISTAYAGYKVSSGTQSYNNLLKFQYVADSKMETIPLKLLEIEKKMNSEYRLGLIWLDKGVYFNNSIFEARIKASDLNRKDGSSLIIPLDEILKLLKANESLFTKQFFDGKNVIIGDFESDQHETYAGTMPGSLILTNLFLGMQSGDNQITLNWIWFMLAMFTILSWLVLFPAPIFQHIDSKLRSTAIGPSLIELLTFCMISWFISLISYLLFHKHIDVFFISIYLTVLSSVRSFLVKSKQKKHVKTIHPA